MPFISFKAKAEGLEEKFSAYYEVKEDLTTTVRFTNELNNNSSTNLISKFTVSIPYKDAKNISISRDGVRLTAFKQDFDDHIELTVDLFENPVKLKTTVFFDTYFTTSQAADDFYGLKRILLGGIDGKIGVKEILVKVPDSFGDENSGSLQKENGVYKFTDNSNIYLTFGQSANINFGLTQKLENNSTDLKTVQFLLPRENDGQLVYYDPVNNDPSLVVDSDYNNFVKLNLNPNETKDLSITGMLRVFQPINNEINKNDYLKESSIWNFKNEKFQELNKKFENSENKIKDIYDFVLDNYSINQDASYERKEVSTLIGASDMNAIQYCDLLTALLRSNAIPANLSMGHNFAFDRSGKENIFTPWVTYYDESTRQWKVLDPYFVKSESIKRELSANPDRIEYFIIKGSFNEQSFDYFFKNSGKNFIELKEYNPGKAFSDEEPFDLRNTTDGDEPLNIPFSAEILFKNASFKPLGITNATFNGNPLSLTTDPAALWVLPGQEKSYKVSPLILTGLSIRSNQHFIIGLTVKDLRGNQNQTSFNVPINGIITWQSFMPLLALIIFLAGIIFLGVRFRKQVSKFVKSRFRGKA
jgi:hypothetical protein